MSKLLLLILVLFSSTVGYSQHNSIIFKKRNKTVKWFWQGQSIAFQQKNKEWRKGVITRIANDSFYIRPIIIQYTMMSIDTISFPIEGYSFIDIYAMPRRGYLIDYKNGHYEIIRSAGHQHFYWVKSGWLFRTGGLGYAGLSTANGLIKNDFKGQGDNFAIAGGVFLFGVLLKKTYKPTLRIRRKYHMEMMEI